MRKGRVVLGQRCSAFLTRSRNWWNQGLNLGDADDQVFRRTNSKQGSGAVGLLTDDVVTRTTLYEQAVILALIPFKNPGSLFRTHFRKLCLLINGSVSFIQIIGHDLWDAVELHDDIDQFIRFNAFRRQDNIKDG